MKKEFVSASVCVLGLLLVSSVGIGATIDMVTVGNPGNPTDNSTGSLYGSVAYQYNIGKYEVTNAQYAEFLNAVDPGGINARSLYSSRMGSDARGGISFTSGNPNGSKYAVRTNMGNKPVNFVSFWDAARMSNWLHNGQGAGDTETGAYTLTPAGISGNTIARNPGAKFFIPTEDEWYKAAYYEPGASTNGYWDYPTRSDAIPTIATANAVGDISNPGTNVVNYWWGAHWNGEEYVTTVGTAGPLSASFYGTFDQGGNVWEWNETIINTIINTSSRGLRGGAFEHSAGYLLASVRGDLDPAYGDTALGFRVAEAIPEPATMGVVSLLVGAWTLRRRMPVRR